MTSRKRAVSIRMSASDIGSVKKLARRLGARDSDVIRCAVKMMMTKLGPLTDSTVRGRNLVPVFVESGSDLFRHFELDVLRLENIINEGVPADIQVAHEDIQLLAMHGVQRSYVKLRLNAIATNRDGENADTEDRLDDSLRQYLYDKYVYRANGAHGAASSVAAAAITSASLTSMPSGQNGQSSQGVLSGASGASGEAVHR